MDVFYAKKVLEALANGVNPSTGELLPKNDCCNQPDVIRALLLAVNVLDKKSQCDRPLPENAGKPWEEKDDQRLSEMYDSGSSVKEMSKKFKRTSGAINSRLARLGKLLPKYN